MKTEASSSGGGCNVRGESVIMDLGRRRSSCGYCKSAGRTSISHGLWAYSLTVDDYQDLLDRGWRRSGCFLYKPEMDKTCCPSYTIRLKAGDFAPSKEQLRVYRRMQRFLDGMLDIEKLLKRVGSPNASGVTESSSHLGVSSSVTDDLHCNDKEADMAEQFLYNFSDQINSAVSKCVESGELPSNVQFPKAVVKMVSQSKRKLLAEGSEDLLCTCNIPFIITAALRRAKSAEKKADHVITTRENAEDITMSPKSVAEMLVNSLNQLVKTSGLSVRACNGHINVYSTSPKILLNGDVQVVSIPEKSANAKASKSTYQKNSSECPPLVRRKFELRLKSSSFDPEEYALYRKYQLKVHNDTPDHVTESSYRRFLVDTPLVFVSPTGDSSSPPSGFGSFHQQYIIDGQLVAVGVVDILPRCLSSKYLFWDPDHAFLSLGKYSALQEIDWVKENQIHCPSLQYYYLGYYIHSCRKMRYKAAYCPSELLCPLRYQWVPFDVARPLLDRRKYVVLSDFSDSQKGASSKSFLSESVMEQDDFGPDGTNDILIDGDEEMADVESSEDELDVEANDFVSLGTENGHDVANILLGLRESRVRYKDVERAVGPSRRKYLEAQLRRYQSVVGVELSERLIYVLG